MSKPNVIDVLAEFSENLEQFTNALDIDPVDKQLLADFILVLNSQVLESLRDVKDFIADPNMRPRNRFPNMRNFIHEWRSRK